MNESVTHALSLSLSCLFASVYGADGKRSNTRAVRWRDRYTTERNDVLERIMSMNPVTRQSNIFKRKRTNKIPIPIDKHPTYNFIGLIIGPRGKTQKELEAKTGCKIAIRGRGSVKEGARGRRDGKFMEGDDEPLHVVITGDDQKSVDAATDMINQMLVVIDDEKNVHKQQQLRELALLNGTLKEDEYCSLCAEKGHRAFECPRRFSLNKQAITVKCAICGDSSHPTRDCPLKGEEQRNTKELDSDYMSFMAELDGRKVEKPAEGAAGAPDAAPLSTSTGITIIKPADKVSGGSLPPPPSALALPPQPADKPPPAGMLPPPVGLPPPPGVPPPALPPNGLPPLPLPHPPSASPPPPPMCVVPPPPVPVPAPPPQAGYQYGHQGGYNYGGPGAPPAYVGYHPQGGGGYQQPSPQQQQQQHQQPGHPQQGTDVTTAGWDYRSYYGNSGGDAGGFNWWEQS